MEESGFEPSAFSFTLTQLKEESGTIKAENAGGGVQASVKGGAEGPSLLALGDTCQTFLCKYYSNELNVKCGRFKHMGLSLCPLKI